MGLTELTIDQINHLTLDEIEERKKDYKSQFSKDTKEAKSKLNEIGSVASRVDAIAIGVMQSSSEQEKLHKSLKENQAEIDSARTQIAQGRAEVIELGELLNRTEETLKDIESDGNHRGFSLSRCANRVKDCCIQRWENIKDGLYIASGASLAGFVGYYATAAMTPYSYVAALSAGSGVVIGGATVYCLIRCRDLNNRCCRWIKRRCCC